MATLHKSCIDCGQPFQFTDAEQAFYKKNNLADPKRCALCRRKMRPPYAQTNKPANNECFECNERLVRGVITDNDRHCLACGRVIPQGGTQYAVFRGGA